MTDTGFLSAGTTSNDGVGDTAWSNMGNATSSNNSYMTAALGSGTKTTQTGLFTNFGFAIPTGATILGVEVLGERKTSTGTRGKDQTVQLIKGGTQQGNNKASATAYTTSDVQVTYGGATDLWGLTLTYSDINASNFGVAFRANNNASGSATVSVDVINIKVYYSAGDATASPTGNAGTGSAGTLSATADSSKTITGNAGTGSAGTLSTTVQVNLSGNAGTGSAGTLATTVEVNLSGNAGTGAAGTLTATADSQAAITGNAGTGTAGTVTATGSTDAPITGNTGTGAAGTLTATGDANASLTGNAATGSAGTVTADAGGTNANASITGALGYAGLGAYLQDESGIPIYDESGDPILVEVGNPGTVTAIATATSDATVNLVGASGSGVAGNITATGNVVEVADTHDGWKKRKKAQKLLDEARRRREQEKLQDIQDLRQQLEAAFNPESEEETDLTPEQAEQKFQQVAPVVFDFKDDGFAKLAAAELQLIQRLISKLEAERQDEEDFAELVAMGVI